MSGDKPSRPMAAAARLRCWWLLPLAAAVVIAFGAAFGLASFWQPLHEGWTNPYGAFSHGYLVLAMSAWMGVAYWRDRPPTRLQPSVAGFVLLMFAVVAVGAMDALFLNASRVSLLPVVLLAAIAAVFGMECARRLFWPAAFLYAALPQWWVINGVLQSLTITVVSGLIRLTGLAAYVEGNIIHVPAGVFEVASGCSGLSYLIAALSLAGFHALLYMHEWRHRLLLLGTTAILAILANWVRVYTLIVIGIKTDMRHYLIRVEHLYFGWAIFMVLLLPAYFVASRLSSSEATPARSSQDARKLVPVVSRNILIASVAAGLALLVPRIFAPQQMVSAAAVDVPRFQMQIGGAARIENSSSEWKPDFLNAQSELATYEGSGSQPVEVFRAVYPHQTMQQRLIRPENHFLGSNWRPIEEARLSAKVGARALEVVESRGYLAGRETLVWSWYWVAGRPAATKLGAKALEAWGLAQRRRDAAAFALSTPCLSDCTAARERLRDFTRRSGTTLYWHQ